MDLSCLLPSPEVSDLRTSLALGYTGRHHLPALSVFFIKWARGKGNCPGSAIWEHRSNGLTRTTTC